MCEHFLTPPKRKRTSSDLGEDEVDFITEGSEASGFMRRACRTPGSDAKHQKAQDKEPCPGCRRDLFFGMDNVIAGKWVEWIFRLSLIQN